MSVEENVRATEEVWRLFNAHDVDGLMERYADSVEYYEPELPEPLKERAAVRQYYEGIFTAFPDAKRSVVRAFGQGDWVSVEDVFTGTHKGPLTTPDGQTIPATNRTLRVSTANILKLEGGKVTERRVYFDVLGFVAQLGLAPE